MDDSYKQRMLYFKGEFLNAGDFETEQEYHQNLRLLHNKNLHSFGIVTGLVVTADGGTVTVNPGIGIDAQGRELVLDRGKTFSVSATGSIVISYHEKKDDATKQLGEYEEYKRTNPFVEVGLGNAADGIVLAKVTEISPVVLDSSYKPPCSAPKIEGDLQVGRDLNVKGTFAANGNAVLGGKNSDSIRFNGTILGATGQSSDLLGINVPVFISDQPGIYAGKELLSCAGDASFFGHFRHQNGGSDDTNAVGIESSVVHNGSGEANALNLTVYGDGEGTKKGIVIAASGGGNIVAGDFTARGHRDTAVLSCSGGALGDGSAVGVKVVMEGDGRGTKSGAKVIVDGAGPKEGGSFLVSQNGGTGNGYEISATCCDATSISDNGLIGLRLYTSGETLIRKQGILCAVNGKGEKYGANIHVSTSDDETRDLPTIGLFSTAYSDSPGEVKGVLIGVGGSGSGKKEGVVVSAAGGGDNVGGSFSVTSSRTGLATGVACEVANEGNEDAFGVLVNAKGTGSGRQWGVKVASDGPNTNIGGQFYAGCERAGYNNFALIANAAAGRDSMAKGIDLTVVATGGGSWGSGVECVVVGDETASDMFGIRVKASGNGSGRKYALWSSVEGNGSTLYAGWFQGNVHIQGTLSKTYGSFVIDHPLDPYNKTLRHSFVESPEELCLYRGKARLNDNGEATVLMPEYFAALTKEDDATVSLTPIGRPFPAGYDWNSDCTAFIIYGDPNREVSYLVLAVRDDPAIHQLRRPVEEEKGEGNFTRGEVIFPQAYGEQPQTVTQP